MAVQLQLGEADRGFAPERLTLIRERRGLSISQLARLSGVADKSIRNAEAGKSVPSDETVDRLASTLVVPPAFFRGNTIETLGENAASFRAATKLPRYRKRSALAAGAFAMEIADFLASHFDLPAVQVPDLSEMDPETAAHALRTAWGLGNGPAPNMVHLLESKGVLVTALVEDCRELDAYSFWREGRPFVVLNTVKSGERGRADAAHELGHLVLHRDVEIIGKAQEDEAQTFAGVFLFPTPAARATGMRNPNLDQVLTVKAAWQMSATMFVRRLADVGLLTDWSYRTLMIELSQRGFRSGEPNGIPRETSQLLASALRALRAEGMGMTYLAEVMRLEADEVREYLFGLVLV